MPRTVVKKRKAGERVRREARFHGELLLARVVVPVEVRLRLGEDVADHRALAQRALARLIVRLGLASERRAVRAHVGVDLAAAPVAEREDRGAAASGRGRAEVRDARGHHRPVARRVPDLRAERRSCLRKRRGAG